MKYLDRIIAVIILLFIAYSSAFIVPDGMRASTQLMWQKVSLQKNWLQPGLHFKWPWVEQVSWLDLRVQALLANGVEQQPMLTVQTFDKQTVNLAYIAVWRFKADIVKNDAVESQDALRDVINKELAQTAGRVTLAQLLNPDSFKPFMQLLQNRLQGLLAKQQIELVSLEITHISAPADQRAEWIARMQTNQQKHLNDMKQQASMYAANLRQQTDNKIAKVLSDAQIQAAQIRGDASAQAAQVYNDAYQKDPSFYQFYHNLKAYEQVMSHRRNVIILGSDAPFLKTFNEASNNERKGENK